MELGEPLRFPAGEGLAVQLLRPVIPESCQIGVLSNDIKAGNPLIGGHRSKVSRLVEAQQGGDVALETDGIETVSLDGTDLAAAQRHIPDGGGTQKTVRGAEGPAVPGGRIQQIELGASGDAGVWVAALEPDIRAPPAHLGDPIFPIGDQ